MKNVSGRGKNYGYTDILKRVDFQLLDNIRFKNKFENRLK